MPVEALTIRAIGNSSGVVLPKELLQLLNVQQGDKLFVSRTPDGLVLKPYNEQLDAQMEIARRIMRQDRAVLRELAK